MIVGQQLQAKAAKQEAELRRAQIAKVCCCAGSSSHRTHATWLKDHCRLDAQQAEKERLAAQKERELAAQEEQMNLLNTSFNR